MDAKEIRDKAVSMADKVYGILALIEKGFMENKHEILADAMKQEHEVNQTERALAKEIMALSKNSSDKKGLPALAQMVAMIERMGDEAASLIERIEIKVHERLLFSDEGVDQFNETYKSMQKSVEMLLEFLKTGNSALKNKIIDNGFHVKELVEIYRKAHAERLVQGLCTPLGANMYFDMLDFTGNLARHSSNIVKLF